MIDSFDLREIALTGRQYTWANSLLIPTYEKLDRVLTFKEWESKYPMVSVHALDRGVSDHTPLFLDKGKRPLPETLSSSRWNLAGFCATISMIVLSKFGINQSRVVMQSNDGITK